MRFSGRCFSTFLLYRKKGRKRGKEGRGGERREGKTRGREGREGGERRGEEEKKIHVAISFVRAQRSGKNRADPVASLSICINGRLHPKPGLLLFQLRRVRK